MISWLADDDSLDGRMPGAGRMDGMKWEET
jgi:hypothetical protein